MKGNVLALYIITIGLILFFLGTIQMLITLDRLTIESVLDQTYVIFLFFGPLVLLVGLILFIFESKKESSKQR